MTSFMNGPLLPTVRKIPCLPCTIYRVSHFIFLYFEQQLFHLRNNFLMFKIRFHILQTLKFYDISSFFDLSLALFHKLVFFKNNFLYQKFFLKRGLFLPSLWGYLTCLTKRLKIFLCLFNKKVIGGGP